MKKSISIEGHFVHVVAKVDLQLRTGKILYVNPTSSALETPGEGDPTIVLRFTGVDGTEITRVHPVLRVASCEARGQSRSALIQQDVPYAAGMSRIELIIDSTTVHTWTAAAPATPAVVVPVAAALAGALMGIKLQGMSPLAGPKIAVEPAPGVDEEAGVTYTVQARPSEKKPWSTLAVGSKTPKVTVDANQFPGRSGVIVRVLKTNGFSEHVIAEGMVKF